MARRGGRGGGTDGACDFVAAQMRAAARALARADEERGRGPVDWPELVELVEAIGVGAVARAVGGIRPGTGAPRWPRDPFEALALALVEAEIRSMAAEALEALGPARGWRRANALAAMAGTLTTASVMGAIESARGARRERASRNAARIAEKWGPPILWDGAGATT